MAYMFTKRIKLESPFIESDMDEKNGKNILGSDIDFIAAEEDSVKDVTGVLRQQNQHLRLTKDHQIPITDHLIQLVLLSFHIFIMI